MEYLEAEVIIVVTSRRESSGIVFGRATMIVSVNDGSLGITKGIGAVSTDRILISGSLYFVLGFAAWPLPSPALDSSHAEMMRQINQRGPSVRRPSCGNGLRDSSSITQVSEQHTHSTLSTNWTKYDPTSEGH